MHTRCFEITTGVTFEITKIARAPAIQTKNKWFKEILNVAKISLNAIF